MAITNEVTCAILRDWQSKKTTFEEKSVEYTEIRQKISHTKSRMRESRTSGSGEGRALRGVRLPDPLTILERRHWREADAAVLHSSTDRKNLIYMV